MCVLKSFSNLTELINKINASEFLEYLLERKFYL